MLNFYKSKVEDDTLGVLGALKTTKILELRLWPKEAEGFTPDNF